jgi:hypothetical protein
MWWTPSRWRPSCWNRRAGSRWGARSAPYFYESLLTFARQPIPFGPDYQQWRADRAAAMAMGKEIAYCGEPDPAS